MLPKKFCIVGLQVLILVFTAESLVILTANVDDIRKVAGKFVNDNIANKIANFVIKTTEYMAHEMEESKLRNIGRQNNNPIRTTRQPKRVRYEEVPYKQQWERDEIEGDGENGITDNNKSFEDYKKPRPYHRERPKLNMNDQYQSEETRPMNIEFQIKKSIRNRDEDRLNQVKNDFKDIRPTHKRKHKPTFKLTAADTEELDGRDYIMHSAKERPALRGFDVTNDLTTLTTEKQRTEFDQYDNPNYPKPVEPGAELAATSGPVQLPKIENGKNWWNNESSMEDAEQKA